MFFVYKFGDLGRLGLNVPLLVGLEFKNLIVIVMAADQCWQNVRALRSKLENVIMMKNVSIKKMSVDFTSTVLGTYSGHLVEAKNWF